MSYYPPYGQAPPPQGGYPYQQPPPGQYPPQQAPYGAPPPQQPYGAPPQQPYGAPPQQPYGAPPPHQAYGAPPPAGYGAPPPAGYGAPPPAGYGQPPTAPYGQQAPPQGAYGAPPPHQTYGAPPPAGYGAPPPAGYGAPPPAGYGVPPPLPGVPKTPATPGYGPSPVIRWDGGPDARVLRAAMKGFGTDEKSLIRTLANKDAYQVDKIRTAYHEQLRRDLIADIKSETGGHLEDVLVALCRGPLQNDVHALHAAISGPGTNEALLSDVLLSRSNADLEQIKTMYARQFGQPLVDAVRSELSFKTERHFMIVLQGVRAEDAAPVIKADVDRDVTELYNATEGRTGTDEIKVCSILSTRNDNQIRAIAYEYQQRYARSLEDVIRREFSGHMESALLFQLHHANDRYMHQAALLENAMAGAGTNDRLLIYRVVRFHWDARNMSEVAAAYEKRYGHALAARIRHETSGDYEQALLACLGQRV